jgi:hypothetical protein
MMPKFGTLCQANKVTSGDYVWLDKKLYRVLKVVNGNGGQVKYCAGVNGAFYGDKTTIVTKKKKFSVWSFSNLLTWKRGNLCA